MLRLVRIAELAGLFFFPEPDGHVVAHQRVDHRGERNKQDHAGHAVKQTAGNQRRKGPDRRQPDGIADDARIDQMISNCWIAWNIRIKSSARIGLCIQIRSAPMTVLIKEPRYGIKAVTVMMRLMTAA